MKPLIIKCVEVRIIFAEFYEKEKNLCVAAVREVLGDSVMSVNPEFADEIDKRSLNNLKLYLWANEFSRPCRAEGCPFVCHGAYGLVEHMKEYHPDCQWTMDKELFDVVHKLQFVCAFF